MVLKGVNNMPEPLRLIQYLGSKKNIVDDIRRAVDQVADEGDLILDLFSGTGLVAHSLHESYRVLSNDVQAYSYTLNKFLLGNYDVSDLKDCISALFQSKAFTRNLNELNKRFGPIANIENSALRIADTETISGLEKIRLFYDGSEFNSTVAPFDIPEQVRRNFSIEEILAFRSKPSKWPYSLFSLYYAHSYFSMSQCMEIDSIRYAIDQGRLSEGDKLGVLCCLLSALSKIVNSVGKHFAQPLSIVDSKGVSKDGPKSRYIANRMMDLSSCMKDAACEIQGAYRSSAHSAYSYQKNYRDVLRLPIARQASVAYLDPPYTIDHYSRFYHVLETCVLYDYPTLSVSRAKRRGSIMNGRYRDDRFQSTFCVPSKASKEFDYLFKSLSELGISAVLSYSDSSKVARKRSVDLTELTNIARRYYSGIQVERLNHGYRKLNAKERNAVDATDSEVLMICQVK